MPGPHYGTFSVRDYSDETSSTSFSFGAITLLTLPGFLTQFGNLRNAIAGIILGTISKEQWVGDNTVLSNTPPTSPNAQVELKWLLTYEGNTSRKKYRMEIPTADPSLLIAGTDLADITDPAVASVITNFETIARTPDNPAEGVNVLEIRLVGRNV